LKTLKIEDMIFDLKRFYMQNNILENLLKFIRWKKKVQEMAWLPFLGIWCTKKINKEINS
jgi:hypothetical protein